MSKKRRILCAVLVLAAYVLALASLASCGIVADALRAAGSAFSSGAADGVREDVAAVGGWVRDLVLIIVGAFTTEGSRYVNRVRKRRKAAKVSPRPPIVD